MFNSNYVILIRILPNGDAHVQVEQLGSESWNLDAGVEAMKTKSTLCRSF